MVPSCCGSGGTCGSQTILRSPRPPGRGRSPPSSCWTMFSSARPGEPRLAYFLRTLRALERPAARCWAEHSPSALAARSTSFPRLSRRRSATAVHITADFAPYGTARDQRVATALGTVPLLATGSPYAVAPGETRETRWPSLSRCSRPSTDRGSPTSSGAPRALRSRFDQVAPARRAAHPRRSGIRRDVAGGRRVRRTRCVGAVSNDSARDVRRRPRSPRARRDVAPVAIPQGRRAPPSHAARRSRAGRRRLSSRAGMA